MTPLSDFGSKNFVEQVSILGVLAQNKDYESIPELADIISRVSRNDAVGLVLRDTLKTLLSGSEDHTVRFLSSENIEVRRICIEVAGQKKFVSAGKALLDLAYQACEEKDSRMLFSVISSLGQLRPEGCIDLFRKCIDHEDSLISSLSIELLGDLQDANSLDRLFGIISLAESDERYEECDLPTASSIKALGKFKGQDVIPFLITKIHHRNPYARRLIHQDLTAYGPEAVKPLAALFSGNDIDEKIFAANILGLIGTREAGDELVKALDKKQADHVNVRFAIYEALGRTSGMTGLVCLTDALSETDQMVLMAVISSLDQQLNQWIIDKIAEAVGKRDDHGRILVKAIVLSRASGIFEGLYLKDKETAALLIDEVVHSGDPEIVSLYAERLKAMGSEQAVADLGKLENLTAKGSGKHILAVDDSKAMLNLYRSIAASMGLSISTAGNGKEALDMLSGREEYCLVITDMNMPVMDGIELIRQIRQDLLHGEVPIIMITTESERSQESLAQKAGATGFLRKPFGPEKLQEMIRTFL